MKKLLALLLPALFVLNTYAQTTQKVTKSSVTFQIKNMGINTTGTFSGLDADIVFDPANPGASHLNASVDATTVNSDNSMRDNHLKSEDYFEVAKYPKITLKSVSINHKSGSNYTGVFDVTIKDKTKQLEMPFTYTESGNSAEFKGTLKIVRTDFGVGGSSMILSKEAFVTIDVQTSK